MVEKFLSRLQLEFVPNMGLKYKTLMLIFSQLCQIDLDWIHIYSTSIEFTWKEQPNRSYLLLSNADGEIFFPDDCKAVVGENFVSTPVSIITQNFSFNDLNRANYKRFKAQ